MTPRCPQNKIQTSQYDFLSPESLFGICLSPFLSHCYPKYLQLFEYLGSTLCTRRSHSPVDVLHLAMPLLGRVSLLQEGTTGSAIRAEFPFLWLLTTGLSSHGDRPKDGDCLHKDVFALPARTKSWLCHGFSLHSWVWVSSSE